MRRTYLFRFLTKSDHIKKYEVESDDLIDAINALYEKPSVAKILSIYVTTLVKLQSSVSGGYCYYRDGVDTSYAADVFKEGTEAAKVAIEYAAQQEASKKG